MLVKNSYTLKSINNHIALIEARGIITSENIAATSTFLPGGATTDLKGEQQAEFEMETQTGMLINCRIKAKVEGTIHVLGREVPITIETSAKIKGERSLP